jgi:hypothetical protein
MGTGGKNERGIFQDGFWQLGLSNKISPQWCLGNFWIQNKAQRDARLPFSKKIHRGRQEMSCERCGNPQSTMRVHEQDGYSYQIESCDNCVEVWEAGVAKIADVIIDYRHKELNQWVIWWRNGK